MSATRGELLHGRYELIDLIATGGMGEVWRATDTSLGRQVAVKLLKAEYADDALFRHRFESEAQHAAALSHPGIAAVFDVGEVNNPDGGPPRPFLVMELVDGQRTIEQIAAELSERYGGADVTADVAELVQQVAAEGLMDRADGT